MITAQRMPEPTAEENIARAILDYQRSFFEALRHSETADVAEAKRIVARANEIVGESGLGPALAPKSARIRLDDGGHPIALVGHPPKPISACG